MIILQHNGVLALRYVYIRKLFWNRDLPGAKSSYCPGLDFMPVPLCAHADRCLEDRVK